MSTPFPYDKYVTGKDFIGRKEECTVLGNLIGQGAHVVLYEPPRAGKTSLVQQALFTTRIKGQQFITGQFSLLNVRTISEFLIRLGTTAIRTVATTPGEFADIIGRHLGGTHFIFDQANYSENDTIISTNWNVDDNDILEMLRLPQRIARERQQQMLLIIDDFQNIMMTEDGDKVCRIMESVLAEMASDPKPGCSFIFSGSMVNAMKDIFKVKHYFYRKVEHLPLKDVDEKEIIEHVVKGFLTGGKIVERELLLGMCKLFRNNLWYINHFVNICDSLSKGYIIENTLIEALNSILAIHEPRFQATMNSLTTFQVSLLRAILDGVTKFSASEVIHKYSLNSSANVKRLREALVKKEIIVFDDDDIPTLQDPLFEYWVRKFYFEMK